MSTIHDARFRLERQLLERRAAGLPADVDQIDVVACEDGQTAMAYVYLVDAGDEPLFVSFDRPQPFDRTACAAALRRPIEGMLH